MISYDYWQTRFRGAPGAVGQKLRVNERDLIVIGVAPREFQGTMVPLKFELWAPATMAPALLGGTRDLEDRSIPRFFVDRNAKAWRDTRGSAGRVQYGDGSACARLS